MVVKFNALGSEGGVQGWLIAGVRRIISLQHHMNVLLDNHCDYGAGMEDSCSSFELPCSSRLWPSGCQAAITAVYCSESLISKIHTVYGHLVLVIYQYKNEVWLLMDRSLAETVGCRDAGSSSQLPDKLELISCIRCISPCGVSPDGGQQSEYQQVHWSDQGTQHAVQ